MEERPIAERLKLAEAEYNKRIGKYASTLHEKMPWRFKENDDFGWKHKEIGPKNARYVGELSKEIAEKFGIDESEYAVFLRQLETRGHEVLNNALVEIPHTISFSENSEANFPMICALQYKAVLASLFSNPERAENPNSSCKSLR